MNSVRSCIADSPAPRGSLLVSAESHSAPVHGDVVLKLSSAYSEGNGGAADAVCPVGPPSATAVAALAYAGHHRTLTEYSRPISTVLSGTSTAAMSVVLTLPESQMGSPPFVNAIWYPCCFRCFHVGSEGVAWARWRWFSKNVW